MAWIPADVVATPDVLGGARVAPGAAWSQRQGADALGARSRCVRSPGLQMDVAIAAYLIDPADVRYALADLLRRYTPFQLPATQAASSGQLDFTEEGDDDRRVAGRGALAVAHLSSALQSALEKQGMAELYATIENPLVGVLAEMEHVGIAVDIVRAEDGSTSTSPRRASVSPPSCSESSAGRSTSTLRCSCVSCSTPRSSWRRRRRPRPGYSTDAATLLRLRDEWPEFIDPLMQYREMEKLRGTYGTGLMAEVAPDGRIHATFNQTVARTGRLSSDQPNLHNIPVRSDEGRQFRKAFIPGARVTCCSSPTTTRSSCAASPISRPIPG